VLTADGVALHEAAVADHIGGEHGGKAASGACIGHLELPLTEVRCSKLYANRLNNLWGRRPLMGWSGRAPAHCQQ